MGLCRVWVPTCLSCLAHRPPWVCHKHSLQLYMPQNPYVHKNEPSHVSSSEKNQKSPPNWPLRVPEGKEIDRPEQEACFDGRAGFGGPLPVTLPRGTWIDGCMTRGHSQAQEDGAPGRRGSTNTLRAHFSPADSILRSHPFSPSPDTGFTAQSFHYKGSVSFPRILMLQKPGVPHCPSVPWLGGNDAWAEGAPRSPGPGLRLCGQR